MIAKELFNAGKITEAQQALSAHLRDHPTDTAARTFLFEVLVLAGEYERAERQLSVLAKSSDKAEMGAVLYYSALHAEKTRHELFQKQAFPKADGEPRHPTSFKGTLNGKPFSSIRDADPDIGARLEVYAAGAYLWISFEHIDTIQIEAPSKLRDTIWTPAYVLTGESFKGTELGEVIIPAIYPFSWKHPDENVWAGRATAWGADDAGVEYPSGQKLFLVDDEEVPLLSIRSLVFEHPEAEKTEAAESAG